MSPDLEGRIQVRLNRGGGGALGAEIRSSRPQLAQRLMGGHTPEEAANLAGLVFSLCGRAQRVAAETACEAAQGPGAGAAPLPDRERTVLIELAQEHARRLLLDWPGCVPGGLPPDPSTLVALRQAAATPDRFADGLEGLLNTRLLGESPRDWQGRDLAGLDAWCADGGTLPARLLAGLGAGPDRAASHAPLLPPLADLGPGGLAALALEALDDPRFCARPLWLRRPAETGALARTRTHPLLAEWIRERRQGLGARLLARLIELARLPERLRARDERTAVPAVVRGTCPQEGIGVAGVETSRGLLIHAVRLEDARVADYRILAPTEWNCHPQGALAEILAALDGSDPDLEPNARLALLSLDPCVAFDLEIRDA